MEGTDRFHRFVVIEFPTFEQAVQCHQSTEYQKAAVFRRDLLEFGDFLDIKQKWRLDQVSFHLHDDVGAARQYAAARRAACEQRDGSFKRRRSFIPQSLHVP